MSKECDFCGKKPQVGNLVSHSNIKTKRRFNPNLQRVRHQFPDGSVRTLTVCTRCLRSGAVTKPEDLIWSSWRKSGKNILFCIWTSTLGNMIHLTVLTIF